MKPQTAEDTAVTIGTHAGHELRMTISPTATMWLRLVQVDTRVYKIAVGTKNDAAKARAFLDSFHLL